MDCLSSFVGWSSRAIRCGAIDEMHSNMRNSVSVGGWTILSRLHGLNEMKKHKIAAELVFVVFFTAARGAIARGITDEEQIASIPIEWYAPDGYSSGGDVYEPWLYRPIPPYWLTDEGRKEGRKGCAWPWPCVKRPGRGRSRAGQPGAVDRRRAVPVGLGVAKTAPAERRGWHRVGLRLRVAGD